MKSWVLHRVARHAATCRRATCAPREPTPDPSTPTPARRARRGAPARAEPRAAPAPTPRRLRAADRRDPRRARALRRQPRPAARRRSPSATASCSPRSACAAPGGAEARDLLQQFMREFKPEQVKRYLAREVIGRLPNAAAIDLSQFAGLSDAETRRAAPATTASTASCSPRCARTAGAADAAAVRGERDRPLERDRCRRARRVDRADARAPPRHAGDAARRPRCEFDVEDGDGRRRVVLHGGRAGPPLRHRQGRELRHPRRRHLHQPAPCRDLARRRRLVGRRCRLDQRHARRARPAPQRPPARAARRRRRRARRSGSANGLRDRPLGARRGAGGRLPVDRRSADAVDGAGRAATARRDAASPPARARRRRR